MSQPPIKRNGLRLAWTHYPKGEAGEPATWVAHDTIGSVSIMEWGSQFEWFVESQRGAEVTLLAAQLMAEEFLRDAMCRTLAAFADGTPHEVSLTPGAGWLNDHVEVEIGDAETGSTVRVLTNHDARRLALALLRAAGTKGGGTP